MFPFGGFLRGNDKGLVLPAVSETMNGGWNDFATVGFRFDLDGDFNRRRRAVYTPYTNSWIHEDSKPTVDSELYETRITNLDVSAIGDATWTSGWDDGLWHQLITVDQNSWLNITGTEFQAFHSGSVTGDIEIREIADTANTVAGTFYLFVSYEGQS